MYKDQPISCNLEPSVRIWYSIELGDSINRCSSVMLLFAKPWNL